MYPHPLLPPSREAARKFLLREPRILGTIEKLVEALGRVFHLKTYLGLLIRRISSLARF